VRSAHAAQAVEVKASHVAGAYKGHF